MSQSARPLTLFVAVVETGALSTLPAPMSDPSTPQQATPQQAMDRALRRLGYSGFRSGQQLAIETLLEKRHLLFVAPTGGGKSLVYQLPACMLRGTTVVVSPLIALMQDQVEALTKRGIPATFLASTLPSDEARQRMAGIARGEYKLVYVSPERLGFGGFQGLMSDLSCPLIAIDEAHCISEWGHDFRPEYMQIGRLLERLPNARVLACTATATPIVRDEILNRLGLPGDTPQLIHGFERPNLVLTAKEVLSASESRHYTDTMLNQVLGGAAANHLKTTDADGSEARSTKAAIIYGPTRKSCEVEADRLRKKGWRTRAYHAGLSPDVRQEAQQAFMSGEAQIVVATNAFGMGVDRADVRAVIHLAPPSSVEAYYQEVGRAGRDGETAHGLMLSSPKDIGLRRHLIESSVDGRAVDATVVEHKWNLFLELLRWAEGGSCRHTAILRYFGTDSPPEDCGRCDVCQELSAGEVDNEEISLLVRKALSGVARVHGTFGMTTCAKLLRGEKEPRLERMGLNKVTTHGILRERSGPWVVSLLRRCVTAGWVAISGGDRPLVYLTPEGQQAMRGERAIRLRLPPARLGRGGLGDSYDGNRPRASRGAPAGAEALSAADERLFDALRAHRLEIARDQGIAPYVVASDRSLRELSQLRPKIPAELLDIYGFGETKAERYGPGLLKVVAAF